jgi:hypothetical protein
VEVLQVELNVTYKKFWETVHMSLAARPVSQPSLDTSPIWTLIVEAEVRKLQLFPAQIIWESCDFILVLYKICHFITGFCFNGTWIL